MGLFHAMMFCELCGDIGLAHNIATVHNLQFHTESVLGCTVHLEGVWEESVRCSGANLEGWRQGAVLGRASASSLTNPIGTTPLQGSSECSRE